MLAVIGSGEYLAPMREVDRGLLGLFDTAPRVVCLPTAAGREGDAMIDSWLQRGVDHFTELGADVDGVRVWDRATAESAELASRVGSADFVYLSGGNPAYLYDTLAGTPTWDAIRSMVERGGLLAGCSAGAMIQGSSFMGRPRRRDGFGLWPGVHVIPHFDEIPSAVVTGMRAAVGRSQTVVGVDGDTAFVHANGEYRVLGSRVTVWTSDGRSEYSDGDVVASLEP